ncbi:histidinol-phosphate transaminase [Bordetella pseudohinzii]|uniref:Histidinol-phosphate aminotransferase n=2 Tax=Bordetella pseudohinzii TaxID=1331258 RepID=A0A0J6F4F1_9BORD|nr:histidinol-phosphate transaminase [Bordetella pseudohinzii]ANY15370.1 histidinol-phosphate transaminase [Bordetella pseudohinzii]KMM27320.1 histidinol-phosphate aminotransferase [Bordetella pseudohinzii]KXA80588.1 histidinol-phosphate aminotransferase [Bordetella pseudohinzii]KXA82497.1 histidinol-phosphate aminotransferase [Bordetella pseudohinzii]CUI86818.1 Histidinol-phosphate aminotransferase [Bordetella pseudohinzii]
MSQYWSPIVATLSPYVPGEQPKLQNLVKLNTNENPYPPSPKALQAIRAAASDTLRLYPDPASEGLCQAVARALGVRPEQVFVGNGSDEVLAHAFQAFFKHEGRPLLFPDISYSFYPVYCGLYQIEHATVALDEAFGVVVDDYLPSQGRQAGGVILPNPNAPTGRALPLADIERLAAGNPQCVVLIDEAYVDFGAESAVALVDRHPNLLVVQTLSKSRSLAGLRVGYAIGHPALIEGLNRIKDSFNSYPIDRLAAAGAIAAIEDQAHFDRTRLAVIATRERLAAGLVELGFEVLPSAANFVFARHPAHDGAALAAQLRERSIIVRHFKRPRIDQFLRITVGTDAECASLITALKTLLN